MSQPTAPATTSVGSLHVQQIGPERTDVYVLIRLSRPGQFTIPVLAGQLLHSGGRFSLRLEDSGRTVVIVPSAVALAELSQPLLGGRDALGQTRRRLFRQLQTNNVDDYQPFIDPELTWHSPQDPDAVFPTIEEPLTVGEVAKLMSEIGLRLLGVRTA